MPRYVIRFRRSTRLSPFGPVPRDSAVPRTPGETAIARNRQEPASRIRTAPRIPIVCPGTTAPTTTPARSTVSRLPIARRAQFATPSPHRTTPVSRKSATATEISTGRQKLSRRAGCVRRGPGSRPGSPGPPRCPARHVCVGRSPWPAKPTGSVNAPWHPRARPHSRRDWR